jgi:hypothetical protein
MAEVVRSGNHHRRAGAFSNMSTMLRDLVPLTEATEIQKGLADMAVRCKNACAALKVCPAVNANELAEMGHVFDPALPEALTSDLATLLESGISLGEVSCPKDGRAEFCNYTDDPDGARQAQADGFTLVRKQPDFVSPGYKRYYKKYSPPLPDINNAFIGMAVKLSEMEEDSHIMWKMLTDKDTVNLKQLLAPPSEVLSGKGIIKLKDRPGSSGSVSSVAAGKQEGVEESKGSDDDSSSSVVSVKTVTLPSGAEEAARQAEAKLKAESAERSAKAVATEEVLLQLNGLNHDYSAANDPGKKAHIMSTITAINTILDDDQSAKEIADAVAAVMERHKKSPGIDELGDFHKGGEESSTSISAGAPSSPKPIESVAPGVDVDREVPETWEDELEDTVSSEPPRGESKSESEQQPSMQLSDAEVAGIKSLETEEVGGF